MEEEIKILEKNKLWELVDRLSIKEVNGVKWVYKTKVNLINQFKTQGKVGCLKPLTSSRYWLKWNLCSRCSLRYFACSYRIRSPEAIKNISIRYQAGISKWIPWRRNQHWPASRVVEKRKEDKVIWLKKALYGLK